jgi:hypothetical protein
MKKIQAILTDMQNWLEAMHVSLMDYPFSADFCFNVYPALVHKE